MGVLLLVKFHCTHLYLGVGNTVQHGCSYVVQCSHRQETPCSPASAKYSRRKEVMKKRFRSLLNSSPVKCSNMFFSTYFSCGCTETDFYPWLHFVRRENQRDICCSFFQSTCQKCIQHCSEIDIYLCLYIIYVDM